MKKFPVSLLAALMLVAGCAPVKDMFVDANDTVLPGERISVLQLQKDLLPDPALSGQGVVLPEAWTNQFWPQAGGYPNHAMGHLTLPAKLQKAWSSSIGAGGDRRTPLTAQPVVAEGLVFTLDTEGQVTAFDLSSGKKKWRQSVVPRGEEDTGAVGGGLAHALGKLFVTSGYKYLVAINPATGSMLWKTSIPSPARAAPTVMDDRVYLITLDNRMMVFSASDGTPSWSYAGVSETTNLLGSAAPAADQSIVVLPLSSGQIFGLRPENGQIAWEDNLSAVRRSGSLSSIADIRGLPVIDQGVVYAASYSGRMVAIDQVTGERLWQRELGSAETPWAAGDTIFVVTSEQQLTALTRNGGEIRWVMQLPKYHKNDKDKPIVWSGPVLAGGRLIVAGSGGMMLEIDAQDGKVLHERKLGGDAVIAPVVAGNTLLVLTENGDLTAWR